MRPIRTTLCALGVSLLAAEPALAALRDPQVPVSGTALASFFASQGQSIAVVGDQQDLQSVSLPAEATIRVPAGTPGPSIAFGGYNSLASVPPLYQMFPGTATAGWFAVASFRTAPLRVVVNLFNDLAIIQGTTTYLGADRTAFSFYVQGPGGTIYSQDARNPGGQAQILTYAGTGARAGATWFACEHTPGPGGDFADEVFLVELALSPVPVERTTWGRVRKLFR